MLEKIANSLDHTDIKYGWIKMQKSKIIIESIESKNFETKYPPLVIFKGKKKQRRLFDAFLSKSIDIVESI